MSVAGSDEERNWPDFVPPDLRDSIDDAPKEPDVGSRSIPPSASNRPVGWHASGNPRWGSQPSRLPPSPRDWQPAPHSGSRSSGSDSERWFAQPSESLATGFLQTSNCPVTFTLMGICVVVWLLQTFVSAITSWVVMTPAVAGIQPWRFFTAPFAHVPGSLSHIGFNMLTLWLMGRYLEPILHARRFLLVYLLSGLGGSIFQVLLADQEGWYGSSLGASGAIFGLFGAYMVLAWLTGRSLTSMWVLLGLNVAIAVLFPSISWRGHLGGLLVGATTTLAITWPLLRGRSEHPQRWITLGVVGLAVALMLAVFLRYTV